MLKQVLRKLFKPIHYLVKMLLLSELIAMKIQMGIVHFMKFQRITEKVSLRRYSFGATSHSEKWTTMAYRL